MKDPRRTKCVNFEARERAAGRLRHDETNRQSHGHDERKRHWPVGLGLHPTTVLCNPLLYMHRPSVGKIHVSTFWPLFLVRLANFRQLNSALPCAPVCGKLAAKKDLCQILSAAIPSLDPSRTFVDRGDP